MIGVIGAEVLHEFFPFAHPVMLSAIMTVDWRQWSVGFLFFFKNIGSADIDRRMVRVDSKSDGIIHLLSSLDNGLGFFFTFGKGKHRGARTGNPHSQRSSEFYSFFCFIKTRNQSSSIRLGDHVSERTSDQLEILLKQTGNQSSHISRLNGGMLQRHIVSQN